MDCEVCGRKQSWPNIR